MRPKGLHGRHCRAERERERHRARGRGQSADDTSPDPTSPEHQQQAARGESEADALAVEEAPADPHAGKDHEQHGRPPGHLLVDEGGGEPPDEKGRGRTADDRDRQRPLDGRRAEGSREPDEEWEDRKETRCAVGELAPYRRRDGWIPVNGEDEVPVRVPGVKWPGEVGGVAHMGREHVGHQQGEPYDRIEAEKANSRNLHGVGTISQ